MVFTAQKKSRLKIPEAYQGQMLHAKVLGFVHPRSGKYMEFDSTLQLILLRF